MAIWKNICIHTHTPPRRLEAFHVRTHLVKKTSQMNTAASKARQGTTRQGKSRQGKACAKVLCKRLRILLPACNSCVTHNVLTYNPQQIQHNAEEKVLPTYYWLVHTITMERQTHSETFVIEHIHCGCMIFLGTNHFTSLISSTLSRVRSTLRSTHSLHNACCAFWRHGFLQGYGSVRSTQNACCSFGRHGFLQGQNHWCNEPKLNQN